MANPSPRPSDFAGQLRDLRQQLNQRIDNISTFDATQMNRAIETLTKLVNDLPGQIDAALAVEVNTGNVNATGNITAAGPIFSPHGRATPVTTGYVGAWLNADGRIGATASSIQFKQDIQPADTTAEVEALLSIGLVRYRYIADVEEHGENAPWHLGSIAEYMQKTALREWVPLDQDGNAFAINWEHLIIPAIATMQSMDARLKALEALIADRDAVDG